MNRVLVTGATGFVGRHLCGALAAAGLKVRAAARHPVSCVAGADAFESCLIPDIGPSTDWTEALDRVDMVVHLAARAHMLENGKPKNLEAFRSVNVEGTRSLARASIRAGIRRLVLLSSVKAMGEETPDGGCFTEESRCRPEDPYGISKWEAEEALREIAAGGSLEVVILRVPLIYGPRVEANFLRLLKAIDRGVPLPLGLARNRRSLLFVGNLTDAIRLCLDHAAAGNMVLLVADEESISTLELVRRLGKFLGCRPRIFPVPVPLLRMAGRLLGRTDDVRRLTGSLLVSTDKIRRLLNWRPPYTAVDGLRRTAFWYRNGDSPDGSDPDPQFPESCR
jgi:nucleoside-diphosphate-sugar epimerase